MRRRKFITLLGGAAAAWPLAARAQQSERIRHIGVLITAAGGAADPDAMARVAAFQQGLQQLGWSDGRNVLIDYRLSAGTADRRKNANWSRLLRTSSGPLAQHRWRSCCRGRGPCRSCSRGPSTRSELA